MRLFRLFVIMAVVMVVPFILWGSSFDRALDASGSVAWLRSYGAWAWAAAILLLTADLLLPVPATVVMSALGVVYGPLIGGLIGAGGSFCSGSLAYWLCRSLGRGIAVRIVGQPDLDRGEHAFARIGGWLVAVSRWLPLLPELIACMAGLTRMPARAFHTALACGAIPMAFVFASVGHAGAGSPLLTLTISAVAPLVLWGILKRWLFPQPAPLPQRDIRHD